jgi:hypothetical protein
MYDIAILNLMYRKVFISYAKEDFKFASELYDFLQDNHYDPWLDKKKLLVGSTWDAAIRKAFGEADFIILLLSSTSVSKRGYVQREYRLALLNWETKLDSDIYIIPVLIDDCKVPDSLSQFQWVHYDTASAFEDILKALDTQRTIYLKDAYITELLNTHYTKTLPLDLPTGLNIESSVEFPQFPQNPFFNADFVNAFVQHDIMSQMSSYSSFMSEGDNYAILPEHLKPRLYFSSYYEIYFISERNLSLILNISFYWGGPYPNHRVVTRNFSFNPVRKLTLGDVIKFDKIKDFVIDAYEKYSSEYLKEKDGHLIARIQDEFENLGAKDMDFVFNSDSLKLISNNILPHAFQGAANIDIPLSKLDLRIAP